MASVPSLAPREEELEVAHGAAPFAGSFIGQPQGLAGQISSSGSVEEGLEFHGTEQEVEQLTFDSYMQNLMQAVGDFDGQDAHQFHLTYFGEFYDYNPEQDSDGESFKVYSHSYSSDAAESALQGSLTPEGQTVASTATYLSSVAVLNVTDRVRGLHLEDFVVDIPCNE